MTRDRVHAGIDIGGTRTKAAAVTAGGEVLASLVVGTPTDLGGRLGAFTGDIVARLQGEAQVQAAGGVRACGVAVPGIVDEAAGVARYAANLGWHDLDVVTAVRAGTGLPVALGHDVRTGLLAEARWGAAAGTDDVLFVPLGTGIAGALMVDGRVLTARGWAGELGHAVVRPGGPVCGCGARGCLEAVASASAIARSYTAASGGSATAADVARLVEAGDRVATAVWQEAVDALAEVIAVVVAATGVRLVVVGGGLANSGDTLLVPLAEALADRRSVIETPRLVRASLGDRAGSLGAAILAEAAR